MAGSRGGLHVSMQEAGLLDAFLADHARGSTRNNAAAGVAKGLGSTRADFEERPAVCCILAPRRESALPLNDIHCRMLSVHPCERVIPVYTFQCVIFQLRLISNGESTKESAWMVGAHCSRPMTVTLPIC